MGHDSGSGKGGAGGEAAIAVPPCRSGIDVPDPEGIGLVRVDEATVGLKADLRKLRLENEDLRFERDRYKASAARYQDKLTAALDELDRARAFREEAEQLRAEIVTIAREFEARRALESHKAAAYEDRLRDEVITLAREFQEKLLRERLASAELEEPASPKAVPWWRRYATSWS